MSDSDKIFLRGETIVDGTGVLPAQGNSWIANDVMLGRARWTTGATVLQQPDCQPGAWQIQPGDRLLRTWRLDGTATADDATRLALSTPIRGSFHYADNAGEPALDNRVCKGDSYIHDTGSDDRYQLHYDSVAGAFKGLGVRADYRTAATALSTAQNSDSVAWRSSRWVTSAAKYRQWRAVAVADASDTEANHWSLYSRREEGSEYRLFDFFHKHGNTTKLYIYGDAVGSVPAIGFTADPAGGSPGSISCVFGPNGTDIDGTAVWFKHGDSTRHVRWRYFGVDDETTGVAAEVLAVTYQQAATGGETIKVSPSLVHRGAAWSGAASVELASYSQLTPTSDTAGYLEHGFDFGSGISRLYNHGLLAVAGSSTGGLLLSRYDSADVSNPMLDSPPVTLRASSMGVSGAEDREFKLTCFVGSPADEGDVWALVYNNGNADVGGVLHDGSRMVGDAAANVLSFTLGAGAHPAVNSGTTKTTPGTVDAWMVLDVNGTTYYSPLYTSKTA